MPTPIIELQRRLALVGAIRAGGEKGERKPGRKLESFRLTSPSQRLIEQAAQLYGGDVTPWQAPNGTEYQVYTTVEELPVLVMPGYSLRQSYELWEGATKRLRLCDGVDEELSGGPCVCEREGDDRCDLYTRLVVALPELDTALGWRLITKGANAAHELPGLMSLIEAHSGGAPFVPARLRIDQRRGVKDGQVVRFVVPTLDLGVGYAQLAGSTRRELPAAAAASGVAVAASDAGRAILPPPERVPYETATQRTPSVDEALGAVSGARSGLGANAAQLPVPDAAHAPAPDPPDENVVEQASVEPEQTKMATAAQKKKLNVLVGKLRDGGHITTDGLYNAIGDKLRGTAGLDIALQLDAITSDGVTHWSPLRESLTRVEANQLIDWLEKKLARVQAVAEETLV